MSVPDHELDDPDYCERHGLELPCRECRRDWDDVRADWAIQERQEGRS